MLQVTDMALIRAQWRSEGAVACSKYAACYIDMEGNIVEQEPKSLLAQNPIKLKHHVKRVKKALSGDIGNGTQITDFYMKEFWLDDIVESRLEDSDALMELYQEIAAATLNKKNPIEVMVYHSSIDIAKKASDGKELEDGDEVYSHIIVMICDTKMQKHELACIGDCEDITIPDRIIKNPLACLVYPAYEMGEVNDDKAIICDADLLEPMHNLWGNVFHLSRTKTTSELQRDFEELIGKEYLDRKDAVLMEIVGALGEHNPYDIVTKEYMEGILAEAQIEPTKYLLSKFFDIIAKYSPTVVQLTISRYAYMRAAGNHRERKKNTLLRAAAIIEELAGAETELIKGLREEADR